MTCDECGCALTPRRTRTVTGTVGPNMALVDHRFCAGCHARVFAEADGRKYPALFDERSDWLDEIADWLTSEELAQILGTSSHGFATYWRNQDGIVHGIEFERTWCADENRWLYRGIAPCPNS